MAYRTIPTSQPWYTAFAFYNPTSSPPRPEIYFTPGHNVGLVSAVLNFNRYPEAVVVATRAYLAIPVEHYYDDFIAADSAAGLTTSLEGIQVMIKSFGAGDRHPREPNQGSRTGP